MIMLCPIVDSVLEILNGITIIIILCNTSACDVPYNEGSLTLHGIATDNMNCSDGG